MGVAKQIAVDLTGEVFHRLTVLSFAGRDRYRNFIWLCRCTCGVEKTVVGSRLIHGYTQSCGCFWKEQLVTMPITHGATGTRAYNKWKSMVGRCTSPSGSGYANYGARGITVCPRWMDFANFYADMGECPDGLTLERIDNDGDYCKENCRWASRWEQARNRRTNHVLEYQGRTQCLMDWATEFGLEFQTLASRLKRGMSLEAALTTPVGSCRPAHYRKRTLESAFCKAQMIYVISAIAPPSA